MQYRIEINHFIGNQEGIGNIILNDDSIGSFSFKVQISGIYIHYLEINKPFQGQKRLLKIVEQIDQIFKKDLFFHAQDLNSPDKSNQKLCNYYKSLGFNHLGSGYFKILKKE